MTENQPEPYVTIKVYKNGKATIEHEGKTLETEIKKYEFRSTLVLLGISLVLDKTIEEMGRVLDKMFEGEKTDEPRKN